MARLQNPLGRAKIKTFSYPDNDEYAIMFRAFRGEALLQEISESQFIFKILKNHYEKNLK